MLALSCFVGGNLSEYDALDFRDNLGCRSSESGPYTRLLKGRGKFIEAFPLGAVNDAYRSFPLIRPLIMFSLNPLASSDAFASSDVCVSSDLRRFL